jgi:hypothetical protein
MDVFQCDDGNGNGCGCLFDDNVVKCIGKLCEYCAEQAPKNE